MSRPDLFNAPAAARYADPVNRGEQTIDDAWNDVRDWFADLYGWPLTASEARECATFWRDVSSRIEETR